MSRRDHSNPAVKLGAYRRSDGPKPKPRAKQPMPLPIRHNICPSPRCGHSNIDVEKVAVCRLCGTEIRALDAALEYQGAGDPAA